MNDRSEKARFPGLGIALVVVLAIYLAGAFWFAQTRSIWSPDCGARLIQVQSILKHPPEWWISYPAEHLDPLHQNSPLSFYESNHGGRTYVFYSFVFALLTAPLFATLGYLGLAVLPVLGGVGAVAATYGLGTRLGVRSPVVPALLLGLATPLALYSVVFWDHAVLTAIATCALYLAVTGAERDRGRFWLLAGALVGAGVWLHEILAPYLPALLVGAWWLRGRHRWLRNGGLVILGFAMLVVPLVLVNSKVYGAPLGPHMSNNRLGSAGSIAQFLMSPDEWGPGALYTLIGWGNANPAFTWQLKAWLANPWPKFEQEIKASLWMAVPLAGWVCLAVTGWWRRWWPLTLVVVLALLGSASWVLRHQDWPHSPFYACPLLLLGFCAPLRRSEQPAGAEADRRPYLQAVVLVTALYAGINLLKPTLGGTEWGSRHLLSIYPVLVVAGWLAIERLLPEPGGSLPLSSRALLAGSVALFLASGAILVHGVRVVRGMHVDNRSLAEAIASVPDEVVVSSVWWAPVNGAPGYFDKKIVFAGDPEHPAPPLFTRMKEQGVRTYTLLGYSPHDLGAFALQSGYFLMPESARRAPMGLSFARYYLVDPKQHRNDSAEEGEDELPPQHQFVEPGGEE